MFIANKLHIGIVIHDVIAINEIPPTKSFVTIPNATAPARESKAEIGAKKAESSSKQSSMAALYEEMVSEKYSDNLKRIFTFILNRKAADGALLFHCSEGKDRTGIVAMILLWLLNVPKDEIMQDYLYTNTINEKKAKKSFFLINLFQGDKEHAENVRDAYLAKEEYLTAAIDKIENDWGNAENFVHKALGIDNQVIENFRKEFLNA